MTGENGFLAGMLTIYHCPIGSPRNCPGTVEFGKWFCDPGCFGSLAGTDSIALTSGQ